MELLYVPVPQLCSTHKNYQTFPDLLQVHRFIALIDEIHRTGNCVFIDANNFEILFEHPDTYILQHFQLCFYQKQKMQRWSISNFQNSHMFGSLRLALLSCSPPSIYSRWSNTNAIPANICGGIPTDVIRKCYWTNI